MVQFKVSILAKLAIISLNNGCNSQNAKSNNSQNVSIMADSTVIENDTIKITALDFKISKSDNNIFDIVISNESLIAKIKSMKTPILKIEVEGVYKIAKGNSLTSSRLPLDCEMFYPLNKENYLILFKNKLSLRKIN